MKARVHVTLKRGVLDPQGEAVRHALALHPEQAPVEQRLPSLLDQLLGPAR